jgi:hypothetical protein
MLAPNVEETPMTRFIMIALWVLALAGAPPPVAAQTPVAATPIAQRYTLDARFDPGTATLAGEIAVAWTNTTGEAQDGLPLRLYPNADYYGEGGISLGGVRVDGEAVAAIGDPDDATVATIPFDAPAAPGEARTVEIDFTTTVPTSGSGGLGLLRGNRETDMWALVNWYPIVAGWEPGVGWYLGPPAGGVDPTLVTASAWDVTIEHPASLALVATGKEETTRAGDTATTRIELPIGRELALVAMPADAIETASGGAGDSRVTVTLPRAWAVPGMTDALLGFAAEAVPRLGAWLAAPLAGELDITAADMDGALGVAWSGSIWLDLGSLATDGRLDDVERESLRFYVYHEIAHQWAGNLLGANTNEHTWMSEGMAGVLAVAVIRDEDGGAAAREAFMGGVAGPYRAFVNGGQDAVADSPVGELQGVVHSFVSYGKGGIGFEAIRQEIGDEAFFGALATLCGAHAWGIVAPAEMLAAFETASGRDLGDLWSFWFEETGATLGQVDAVIAGSGA